ncbi:uncharacterized protein [Montipora capricornis]|uniref:uncharacterized protein n=1 Tax=Montipora capricornis TaxID=246305 RepID=UPI0035F1114B
MAVSLFWLVLFLAVPFHSIGAPAEEKILTKTRAVLQKIDIASNGGRKRLGDLIFETRRAYAKEFFGDPLEFRQVEIRGLERLGQDMTIKTFVKEAYKQLSIFYAVLQDILDHWPHGFERSGSKLLLQKISDIKKKIGELKDDARKPVLWFSARDSAAGSVFPSTNISQPIEVWNQSAYRQKKWILGVLGEVDTSMRYLLTEITNFSRAKNRR